MLTELEFPPCPKNCMCPECLPDHRKNDCEFGMIDGYGICDEYCICELE